VILQRPLARLELRDFYRGLSILSVLLYHYTSRLPNDYLLLDSSPFRISYGYLGVQCFFAISGFCICLTIERSSNWREFLAKRFARLWPAFIVCCLITQTIISCLGLPGREVSWLATIGNFLMLNDFGVPWVDGVYWSLLVEVKYYVIFAILFWWKRDRAFYQLLNLLFAGISLVVVSRVADVSFLSAAAERLLLVSHIAWFALGVAFYLNLVGRAGHIAIVLAVLAVTSTIVLNPDDYQAKLSILLVIIIAFAAVNRFPALALPYWLKYLGTISFPLYLLHQQIGYATMRQISGLVPSAYPRILIVSFFVIALAHIVHLNAEFQFRKQFENVFLVVASRISRLSFRRA
jgi:peptidoglycan/LPS O-acetylase OafA/YrhL